MAAYKLSRNCRRTHPDGGDGRNYKAEKLPRHGFMQSAVLEGFSISGTLFALFRIMKKTNQLLASLALSVALSGAAQAYSIQNSTVNVGNLDTVLAVKTGGASSPADESAWVASVLGTGFGVASNIGGSNILYRTGGVSSTIYAFSLSGLGTPTSSISYFLVKNATTFLLLENNSSKDWAVFNWADEVEIGDDEVKYDLNGRGSNKGQTSISHFALVTGPAPTQPVAPPQPAPPVDVPEPATLGLMGLGLIAAGLRRRQRA